MNHSMIGGIAGGAVCRSAASLERFEQRME
jgi:hypothetical protein